MVEKIRLLCQQRNITIKTLEQEIGFGNGTIRRWDANSPSLDRATKVASYFGVPVDALINPATDQQPILPADPPKTDRAKLMLKLFEQLSPEVQEIFFVQLKAVAAAQEKERLFQK